MWVRYATRYTHLTKILLQIPISTLGAVNKLVSGIAGGASGSLSVSKSIGASAY